MHYNCCLVICAKKSIQSLFIFDRVEVVVDDKYVEPIIMKVSEICATDHVGDGKIFIRNIEEAVRIRTGERGLKAL